MDSLLTYRLKSPDGIAREQRILDFDFDTLTHTLQLSPTAYLEQNRAVAGFTLQPDVVVPPQHSGFAVLGLQFVEIVEGEVYELNAMKALGCALVG